MDKKMTVVEMFNAIADLPCMADYPQYVEFLHKRAELTAKKNKGVNQKKLVADTALVNAIKSHMAVGEDYTVSAMVKFGVVNDKGETLSAPKVTALMKRETEADNPQIVRHVNKGVALYTKVR